MENQALYVGYARLDITPEEPVPLGGMGNSATRISTSIRDRIYTTCTAFSDEQGETALFITYDLVRSMVHLVNEARTVLSQKLGIAPERIMFSASHTHSGPELSDSIPHMEGYRKFYVAQMIKVAEAAMADRKKATMSIGRTQDTEGLNFVRHYTVDENGVRCGHQTQPDPTLQMVKITREGGRDILLMNWQAHPCMSHDYFDKTCLSSDYIGAVRDYLEAETGCHFTFFLGASGNLVAASKITEENLTEDVDAYGKLLGQRALKAMENLTPIAGGSIRSTHRRLALPIDHSDDGRVPDAEKVVAFWKQNYNAKETRAFAANYNINSPYHAVAILRRANSEDFREMDLFALSVGDLGFAVAPYEMFCDNGAYIREHSPFPATFVLSCSNAVHNYLPTTAAFDYGCYERDNRNYTYGSAEMLSYNFVSMLKELK